MEGLKEKWDAKSILGSIFNSLPGVLSVMDIEYNILRENKTGIVKQEYVAGGEEAVSRKCYAFFHKRTSPCPWCKFPQVLATGESFVETTEPGDPRERITGKALKVFTGPIKNDDGEIIGMIEYGLDVTGLRNARMQAQEATRAKSAFLANMSHEIRTPMNGILGMIDLLASTPLTAEQEKYVRAARTSAASLLALLNNILDFSKIEAEKMDLDLQEFDLRDMLDDLTDMMALQAEDKGLEYICYADPDVPNLVVGDPARLRQVLINLVGNALKFTESGEVMVRVSRVQAACDEGRSKVCFSIRDTGIGIPDDKQELLFHSFSQLDPSTSRMYGGSGLGLTISRALVHMMGGEIGARNRSTTGAFFWFTVDLGVSETPDASRVVSEHLKSKRVLVVDDNAACREALSKRLDSWGTKVDGAGSRAETLAMLAAAQEQNEPYDLVVLDFQMPDIDGGALGRCIIDEPSLITPSLVLMVPFRMIREGRRSMGLGFKGYLSKPIKHHALELVLSQSLNRDAEGDRVGKCRLAGIQEGDDAVFDFSRRGIRILVAEDNTINQQVMTGVLGKFGIDADSVANGRELLEVLRSTTYDMIFMDIQMPEMDGYQATEAIRDHESAVIDHDLPIIAMTAHAMRADRERCFQTGMDDYLSKPFSLERLARMIEKWMPARSAADPPSSDDSSDVSALESEDVFDYQALLDRLMGDEGLARDIMIRFLDDMPAQLDALEHMIDMGDIGETMRQAHTLKGAFLNIGGRVASSVLEHVEDTATREHMALAGDMMQDVRRTFEALRTAMQLTCNRMGR